MLWCGHVPPAAVLVFCAVALFAKMCSAIQFYPHVFRREPGDHKESGVAELILFPPLLSFLVCTHLCYLRVKIPMTVYLTGRSYLK